jgi:hypothetical protein
MFWRNILPPSSGLKWDLPMSPDNVTTQKPNINTLKISIFLYLHVYSEWIAVSAYKVLA